MQGGYGALFAVQVQILLSITSVGVQSLIEAASLSPGTNLVAGTGAVSRYKADRSLKTVTVQDLSCGQMRVSGCNGHYNFILRVGAKAKSVTNNLPILSVLAVGFIIFQA